MDRGRLAGDRAPGSRRIGRAIVLAAGASSRMGRPKALLELGGRAVIAHHLDRLAAAADERVVVVGASPVPVPPGVRVVHNPDWATTRPLDSLALALPGADSALVLPVDVLPPDLATLWALVEVGGDAVPVGPDGDEGHPVAVGAATIRRILAGDRPAGGLRTLLAGAPRVSVADPRVGWDFDDPAAWDRARTAFEAPEPR